MVQLEPVSIRRFVGRCFVGSAVTPEEKYSQLHQQNLDRQDELIKQPRPRHTLLVLLALGARHEAQGGGHERSPSAASAALGSHELDQPCRALVTDTSSMSAAGTVYII